MIRTEFLQGFLSRVLKDFYRVWIGLFRTVLERIQDTLLSIE